jgi:phosphate transport system permease protein
VATDTGTEGYAEGFEQVNRTVGTIFRYALLAATLFGVVVVSIFLVYIANDAIQPFTADPGWHLVFFLVLVVPALAVSGYLVRRNRAALSAGTIAIGLSVVSLMFGAGIAMVFVDIVPSITWFSYVLALALPLAAATGIERLDRRVPFFARFGVLAALLVGSVLVVPDLVRTYLTVPTSATFLALSLGAPIALVVGVYAMRRWKNRRSGIIAGGAAFLAVFVSGFVGPLVGLTSVPATVLTAVAVVPTVTYAGTVLDQPERRIGLLVPAIVFGGALVGAVLVESAGFAGPNSWVDWQFLTSPHDSSNAAAAGFYPAIGGSVVMMAIVAVLSFPLGVGTAVYLEEYAPDNRLTKLIDVNISNLAGVPSVVYGLLGLGLFVTYLGRSPGTALIGGATLGLLILPIVIISAREAIRSVPDSMRQASYGMGATRWQTVKNVVLPRAFPGILTGTILALGRAIGETAPLIMIGAPSVLYSLPTSLDASVSAMPLQVFAWATLFASEDFYTKAVPAGIVVLLVILLAMNSVAIVLRNKYQRES